MWQPFQRNTGDLSSGMGGVHCSGIVAYYRAEYPLAKAGWNTQEILSGVNGVLSLAAASGEDLAAVSTILVDSLASFGRGAEEAGYFADILANTANLSTTGVRELGDSLKYVSPVAGALGFNIEEVALMLGLMANNGIKGSQAGTALRATLSRLVKPTKESEQAMKLLNFSAINADGSMKPLIQIVEELRVAFANLTPAEKASTAGMLAGQEAMSGLLSLVNASTESFDSFKTNLAESAGSADAFGNMLESGLGGALRIIRSSLEGILITVGEKLTPYIMSASQVINKLANSFNNLNPTLLTVLTGFGVALAVIPPLIVGIGQLIKIVTSSIGAFKILLPFISGISLPVLAVAAAVGAAVFLIIKYWDEIKAYFTSGGGVTFMDSLKQLWDISLSSITAAVSQLTRVTKELWDKYGEDITAVFKSLASVVTTQLSGIIEFVSLAIRGVATVLTVFSKVIRGDFKGAFEAIKNFAVDAFSTLTSVILSSFQSVLGVASTVAEKLGFESIAKGIDTATQKLEAFKQAFKSVAGTAEVSNPVSVDDSSSSLLESSPELPTEDGGAVGSVKKTIAAIQMVRTEFDITSSFAGKKINEIGKKVMEAGVAMYKSIGNVSFSFDEYMKYFHEFQNGTYVALEGFMVLGDGIQDVFVNLLESGKLSFQGLFKQISLFIAKMIGAIAAAAILSVLVSSIFGGASAIGSAFSFGNLAAQFSGGLLNFAGGKANGGDVNMGSAYMVGERGRELFVPNTSGTIISNDKLGSGTSKVEITGTLTASGSDLKYVLDKENKRRSKI
jgi:TP901 family phage tail tape measure protein